MGESDLMEIALMAFESSDFGGRCILQKQDVPCSPGSIGVGSRFVAGGFSPNAEQTVVIRKSVFTGIPKTGQPITVTDGNGTSRALKVANEGVRDCIFAWELTVDDSNQNA